MFFLLLEPHISGAERPLSGSENGKSSPENPFSEPENAISGPEKWISGHENAISRPEIVFSRPENLFSRPENTISRPEGWFSWRLLYPPPHPLGIYFRRMSAVGYGIITEEELGGQLAFASLGTNADSTVAPVSLGWRCHPKT